MLRGGIRGLMRRTGARAALFPLFGRTDVSAAYSFRNLSPTYKGPVLRARRASDDVELDFSAPPGGPSFLTFATVNAWAGGNAFATTFYDQSGNARNLAQATKTAQPQIINAANSLPALLFDGVDDTMTTSAFTLNQPHSYNGIVRAVTNASGEDLMVDGMSQFSAGTEVVPLGASTMRMIGASGAKAVSGGSTAMPLGARGAVGTTWNGAASLFEINASTVSSFSGDAGTTNAAGLRLGSDGGTSLCNCEWQELISFNVGHISAQLQADNAAMRLAWGF